MIVEPTDWEITRAAELIRQGHLVAFPTETVYGLGADATNQKAVQNIFALKGRPSHNPLIVHLASIDAIAQVVDLSQRSGLRAMIAKIEHLWPGPLSVVLPKKPVVAQAVSAGLASVAVRIPDHPVALSLLRSCGLPIAAPSANRSSYVSPTTAQHVFSEFGDHVPLILDGGSCRIGIESTVISLLESPPRLLRPGAVTVETLQQIFPDISAARGAMDGGPALSPGMLREHYAPYTPLRILSSSAALGELPARVGLIAFSEQRARELHGRVTEVRTLSQSGELDQIAANLFSALRSLDCLKLDIILVESCPQRGLGLAIMDRLIRAAARGTG